MRQYSATRVLLIAGVAALGLLNPASAAAQDGRPRVLADRAEVVELQDAQTTRNELRELLRTYPPTVQRVLQLDPSLLSSDTYLSPYPRLAAFLKQHPEIHRDPSYFFGQPDVTDDRGPMPPEMRLREESLRFWRDAFQSVTIFAVIISGLLAFAGLVRYVVNHRRWLRAARTHTDMQAKLLDRFASNDDLLAYIQSPTGKQLLTAMPSLDPVSTTAPVAAPFARILWAVQAGVVLASAGVGLLIVRQSLMPEIAEGMLLLGGLGLSLGIGFGLAALASLVISRRLGLIDPPPSSTPPSSSL